jgi:hypothetical protein
MRTPNAHERRIVRRLVGRGLAGLGEALCRLVGTEFGGRYRIEMLFAAGAEGAVFLARDLTQPGGPAPYVAKIPLLLYHKPISLDSEGIRRRRAALREEGRHLTESASPYMPKSHGVHDMTNPLLDPARGGAFAEPEPVLVMERLPGRDLDVWLARMHRSDVDVKLLRRTLDSVTVAVLKALWDLQERGYYYADLRPGNVRIGGRDRRARLLDAGSMVLRSDCSGRFPHVPAYLPPDLFHRIAQNVDRPFPTAAVQAVMAGRTLHEVATGQVPVPGEQVDLELLWDSRVSQPVADTIDGLCSGSFTDVLQALKYLNKRAARRVPSGIAPPASVVAAAAAAAGRVPLVLEELAPVPHAAPPAPAASSVAVATVAAARTAGAAPTARAAAAAPSVQPGSDVLPPSRKKSWWRRLVGG